MLQVTCFTVCIQDRLGKYSNSRTWCGILRGLRLDRNFNSLDEHVQSLNFSNEVIN